MLFRSKFYQASTSELFGSTPPPQNEMSRFAPRSPYAAAKLMAYWATVNYREGYGLFTSNGILFNHESPRRGETFVTRKISKGAAEIALGIRKKLFLGNLDAVRDWGYAQEYVESMWMMLQQPNPDDYVLATGVGRTVEDFCVAAYSYMGLEPMIETSEEYKRPLEVDALIGDASKAERVLGWKPDTTFQQMVSEMMEAEIARCSVR